ncbi:MAG: HRDC domain-containing protein, partial [Planctomycetaceae bacterium]|nr:HRDC domain-containing protein [Planctomycetaceae bacterium]
ILGWIGQLTQQGYLNKVGEYSMLQITATGWQLLKGEATPRLLVPASTPAARSSRGASRKHDPHSWEGVDRGLFEALRNLRTEKANDLGLAPYMVFGDATLRDMARRRPTSDDAFLQVHGVGQKKCEDYAAEFTALIREHCREQGLETDIELPATAQVRSAQSVARRDRPNGPTRNALASFTLFDEGKSVQEVADEMGRALSTTHGYLANYIEQRQITEPSRWVDAAKVERIEAAIAETGSGPLKPVKDIVGDEIDYDTIRIVMWCWKNRHTEEPAT